MLMDLKIIFYNVLSSMSPDVYSTNVRRGVYMRGSVSATVSAMIFGGLN